VAESDGLLNRCTGKTVPGVRIPPSPPFFTLTNYTKGLVKYSMPAVFPTICRL
jgi:hypothetical protein